MPPRRRSRPIDYVVVREFHGGISAARDKVQMPLGFTPMARNVEWREQGGFYCRKGVGRLTYGRFGEPMAAPGKVVVRFFHYVRDPTSTAGFTSQYMVATEDGNVYVGVDFGAALAGTAAGAWYQMLVGAVPFVSLGSPTFTPWDTDVYLSLGVEETSASGKNMVRWNGTTATALGKLYVNDYAAPTGGNMPAARYINAWAERMWAACMIPDSGAIEGSVIRWSHPGRPEDWASNDYIEVGQAGDVITGIAPMRDMLVVFKRSSTYALLGSGASNFRVVEISGTIGCTGEWTRDNQGGVVFWDATTGACRFDGKGIEQIFKPLMEFIQDRAITRCGGLVTDGDRVYVATDFVDYYGDRVTAPLARGRLPNIEPRLPPRTGGEPLVPGNITWQELIDNNITWAATAGVPWLRGSVEFYNIVWVYRDGAGWTSFTLTHPDAHAVTMLGQIRSRPAATNDIESNRRIVYGLSLGTAPLYLSDRYDDGNDWWSPAEVDKQPIDSFYMTPWLHGGLPAQIKRWKAPRVIQEADYEGTLLIDVYYDFNYDYLRRTLRVAVVWPEGQSMSFDSFTAGKPGTIGRAKAVMLVLRPEQARHWGISSLTIPLHPKVLR